MKETINSILENSVETVLKDGVLTMNLLRVYSTLYLAKNEQPRTCASAIREYYGLIKKEGIMKVDLNEQIKNRTCKPKWNGNKYIMGTGEFISSLYITDEKAKDLLAKGKLKESDFLVLPKINGEVETIETENKPKKGKKSKVENTENE